MLSICQICLSTDRKLEAIKEPLSNWHDELCDFGIEDYALYCSECAYMLNKFHDFKEKCLRANKLLKKWKKQNPKVRSQLSQLKKEMPSSSLSVSNIKNHKIYFYKSHDIENQNSILYTQSTSKNNFKSGFLFIDILPNQTSSLDNLVTNSVANRENLTNNDDSMANIFLKDISYKDNTHKSSELKTILIEPFNENEFLKESEVKIEDDILNTETIVVDELRVKNDVDGNNFDSDHHITDLSDHHITDHSDDDGEFNIEKLLNENLNSDSSDDEILLKKRKKSQIDIKKINKIAVTKEDIADTPLIELKNKKIKTDKDDEKKVKRNKRPLQKVNMETIKYNLLCKFGNKEVKDDDGNVIDRDCIIESLDKMHKYTLNKVKRHCLGSKPFTPEAIQVLSQIQKRYGNQFSSVFTTVHLTTTELALEEFNKRQLHVTFLSSDHQCTLCYRGFKHRKLLDYHLNEYHNPERAHVCPICQMRFKSAAGLCKHNAAHRVVYKCKLCPLITNYRTVMENHYNQHNGVKYTCELCKAVLNSKTSLNAHINYIHPSRYICPLCARTFVSEIGLTQHKIRKHPDEEMTEGPDSRRCEPCAITFLSDGVYQKHMAKSHADRTTAANYALTYRKRKMTGKRQPPNFVCRVCCKVEHSIGRMTWHFNTEHPNENTDTVSMCSQTYKHLCHLCGKGYASITDFNEHKHLHTGARPYACDKCPKAFHRKTNLRMHLERHYPPTRECQHCGKKFLSAANLNNHIRMHIGIRRYTCELCAKSFLHRSALNAHVRGVHLRIRRNRKTNKELAE